MRIMTDSLIEVRALRKEYRSGVGRKPITALDGIDFTVRAGELFGLLGPNGAGKTTTVKIVLGLTAPTDGVDPVGRREIRDLLREEAKNGTAVLLNSHLLSEIELTCDRVAVLRNGKVAAEGTIEELTRRSPQYKMVAAPLDESLVAM